jgi:FkbH-like protein
MSGSDLYWLPARSETWARDFRALAAESEPADSWARLVALANYRLDFIQTRNLDSVLSKLHGAVPPAGLQTKPIRLAVLGSSTVTHLLPGIRIAALRRGIWLTTYETDYGQYLQELLDRGSALHAFSPTAVLFVLDAYHLFRGVSVDADASEADAFLDRTMADIDRCWELARDACQGPILQQTVLPVFPTLLGSNEQRLAGSPTHLAFRLNARLRQGAETGGVHLVAVDQSCAEIGLSSWHSPVLWFRAKQETTPVAAPLYGELVARVLAACQGRSFKALVLDLDNTLWGGVIGDDGMAGIALGAGSALGEAFVSFQSYAKDLARRGVILAVCSKNDHSNAIEPFRSHPEMVLREADIACFVANWDDKAGNIRRIARELNIGLDAIVFADDNPFERNLVRGELPMVAVPEFGEDAASYRHTLAAAGYFEAVTITADDRERRRQYQQNQQREAERSQSTDLAGYLAGLEMQLIATRFNRVDLLRTVQLINKTNQFNLTTRRYEEADVVAIMNDSRSSGLSLRLLDRYGDNGIISIVILRPEAAGHGLDDSYLIDTWLMSCRVLGRGVEDATLNVVVSEARRLGAARLVGEYRPTAKNGMVREHYERLGFASLGTSADGASRSVLELAAYEDRMTSIRQIDAQAAVAAPVSELSQQAAAS